MKQRFAVVAITAILLQAVTGCRIIVPGVGLIIVVGWPVIAGITLVVVILIAAIVLATYRS